MGPCIEACAQEFPQLPVLKPNEAMIEEAVARAGPNGRIALLASFAATLRSMPQEFTHVALGVTVFTALATDALSLPRQRSPEPLSGFKKTRQWSLL